MNVMADLLLLFQECGQAVATALQNYRATGLPPPPGRQCAARISRPAPKSQLGYRALCGPTTLGAEAAFFS